MLTEVFQLIFFLVFINSASAINQFTCNPEVDCNLEDTMIKIVPDPVDCTKFYRCKKESDMNGTYLPIEPPLHCPKHNYFNGDPNAPECIPGSCRAANCQNSRESSCKTSCGELDGNSGKIAFPGDCTKFYFCFVIENSIQITVQECPAGKLFTGEKCEIIEEKNACSRICVPPSCKDHQQLPDRTSPQNFYYCLNNKPILQTCGKGELFDIRTNECTTDTEAISGIFCNDLNSDSSLDRRSDLSVSASNNNTKSIDMKPETISEGTSDQSISEKSSNCDNVNDFDCLDEGCFAMCKLCNTHYIWCELKDRILTAHEETCYDGQYVYPDPDLVICMPKEICNDLLVH